MMPHHFSEKVFEIRVNYIGYEKIVLGLLMGHGVKDTLAAYRHRGDDYPTPWAAFFEAGVNPVQLGNLAGLFIKQLHTEEPEPAKVFEFLRGRLLK
jgi:hypothetical protein